MSAITIRDTLIPRLHAFCGVPIIEADSAGNRPTGAHATYKFTRPYGKDVGRADEITKIESGGYKMIMQENYKMTISITAYDKDNDISYALAQEIYDWFGFHGADILSLANVVVVEKTDVQNRDAFVVEEYERRNGFDVIIRTSRKIERFVDYIETVQSQN